MKITVNNELCYVNWQHVNNVGWNCNKLGNQKKEKPLSYTTCEIVNVKTGESLVFATAYLGKKENHYNKDKGRKVALKKALAELEISKKERKQVWMNYFKETNQHWILYKISKDMDTVIKLIGLADLMKKLGLTIEDIQETDSDKNHQ